MGRKKRILYVIPVAAEQQRIDRTLDQLNRIKDSDTEVEVIGLENGPEHLEYHLFEHVAVDQIINKLLKLKQSYDAIVVACFYDPGSRELRELMEIPIVFPAEACMHIAAMLGHKFSIIVATRKCFPKMLDNAKLYGLESRLASMRAVDMSVVELRTNHEKARELLTQECKRAIEIDYAEIIILGCTAFEGLPELLQDQLGIPVLDPVMVTFKVAELFAALKVNLGISPSKKFLNKIELGYAFSDWKELERLKDLK